MLHRLPLMCHLQMQLFIWNRKLFVTFWPSVYIGAAFQGCESDHGWKRIPVDTLGMPDHCLLCRWGQRVKQSVHLCEQVYLNELQKRKQRFQVKRLWKWPLRLRDRVSVQENLKPPLAPQPKHTHAWPLLNLMVMTLPPHSSRNSIC